MSKTSGTAPQPQQPPKKCVDADDCGWSTTQRCNPTCDYYNIGIPLRSRPHTSTPESKECGVSYCGIQTGMCAFLPEQQKCPLQSQHDTAVRNATLDEVLRDMDKFAVCDDPETERRFCKSIVATLRTQQEHP